MTDNDRINAIHLFKTHNVLKLNRLDNEFRKLRLSISEFISNRLGPMTPKHQIHKRGLINVLGEISSLLIGTATQRQIDEIHQVITSQNTFKKETLDQLNLHSHILNETIADLASLHSIANQTANALNALQIAHRESTLISFKIQILLSILNELDINLNIVRSDYNNIVHGISDFLDGYPSTHIISDKLFLSLLSEAAQRGNGLLFPQQYNNLPLYRKTSKIFTRSDDFGSYFFYLTIPLASHTYGSFNVYEVNSLPLPIPNSTQFIQYIKDARYLAVSEDGDRFLLMDNTDNCIKHSKTLICHPESPIMTKDANNCMFAVFTSQPKNTCNKILLTKFSPIFIRVNNGYLYATDSPLNLRISCNRKKNTIVKISNSGFLEMDDECFISSETFSVPSHMSMMLNEINVPLNDQGFSYIIPQSFQTLFNDDNNIQNLLNISTDIPISLSTAASHLKLLNEQEQNNRLNSWASPFAFTRPTTAMPILAIVSCFALGGLIYFIFKKYPFLKSLSELSNLQKLTDRESKGLDSCKGKTPVRIVTSQKPNNFPALEKMIQIHENMESEYVKETNVDLESQEHLLLKE